MILGRVRENVPLVLLSLPGRSGPREIEFVLDTGFEGDLSLPFGMAGSIDARPAFGTLRALADGTIRRCPVYETELDWDCGSRTVQILILEGSPLLGTGLLLNCRVEIEFSEGGAVQIEFAGD